MEMFQQLLGRLKALPRWTKVSLGIGLVVFIGLVVGLILLSGRQELVALFTGLDPRDSGEIVRKLDEQGIPYRLSDQGRTILVPQDQVYRLRIDLAAEGLPSGGVVGLESFKEASFGSTEFDRRVQYAAALQGELTRTLRQLEEVEDARVHLVIPEQSIFLRDRYEPTASVLVKLRPGRTLSEWQIRGIVNLVAYSVEGMKPKNVTVVDTQGNTLSAFLAEDGVFQVSGMQMLTQFQLQQQYERHLEDRLRGLLEQVFGFGRVVARVSVSMDFDYREITSEIFEPGEEGQLIRSEQLYEETFRGSTEIPGGIAGISSNIPTYEQAEGSTVGDYAKSDITRNYELNRHVEKTIVAPGKVTSCSAAVWIDGELTPELEQQVRETALATLGLGDRVPYQVAVYSTAFAATPFDQPDIWEEPVVEPVRDYLPWALFAAALVIIIILIIVLIRRRKHAPAEESAVPEWLKAAIEAAADDGASQEARNTQHDLQQEISRMYKEQPTQVIDALRAWLGDV